MKCLVLKHKAVIKAELVAHGDHIPLQGFVHRNAGVGAFDAGKIFLFPAGVDALGSRCLFRFTQRAQDISGGLAEIIGLAEALDVDGHKVVTEFIGFQISVGIPGADDALNRGECVSPIRGEDRELVLLIRDDGKKKKEKYAHYIFLTYDQLEIEKR